MSGKKSEDEHLPSTWSSDDSGGTNPPGKTDDRKERSEADEGIRPDDLTTENDQGAG